ncbi:zinc-binding dehydrogenase [Mesorhizobium sp. 43Arga]
MAGNLIAHVRNAGQVASIVPVPDGANIGNRVTIRELYHRTDAATLEAVLNAASQGLLPTHIASTFPLKDIGAAHSAVATGARGKIVLKH